MTAITEQAPHHIKVTLPHAIKDTLVITHRNLLRNVRLPQLLIFATVQPVMFLLLFNFVFGGAIGGALPPIANGNYLNWLMPGLLIQVAAFGSGQTALGLTEDLSKGVIERFRSLPMARSAVLAGRTLSDLIRNGFVITLMLVVGFLIGFRWQTSFLGMLGGMLVAMVFAYSLSWVMATIVGDGDHRVGGQEPRGGPVGRVPAGVPFGVRLVRVRTGRDHAVVAGRLRREPADHGDGQRSQGTHPGRGGASSRRHGNRDGAAGTGVGGRNPGDLRSVVGAHVPPGGRLGPTGPASQPHRRRPGLLAVRAPTG